VIAGKSDFEDTNMPSRETALEEPRRTWVVPVLSGLMIYVLLYGLFFPVAFATNDENEFLRTAHAVMTGAVFDRNVDSVYHTDKVVGGMHPFKGRSLLFSSILALLLPLEWESTFLVGLIAHLLTFCLMAWVFGMLGQSRWWAWLVLLHPTLSLFSRMIMADVPSGTMVALILALLIKTPKRAGTIGVIAGLAMFLRLTNCWIGFAAAAQLLIDDLTRRDRGSLFARLWQGDLKRFLGPFVILCALLLVGNDFLYGGPLRTHYSLHSTATFSLHYLVRHLPVNLFSLSAIWPFMLLSIFWLPKRVRWFGLFLVAIQLIFFSSNPNFCRGYDLGSMLVRSMRYYIGSVVVLCVGYPRMLETILSRWRLPRVVFTITILAALMGTFALFRKHNAFLAKQASVVNAAYAYTPADAPIYYGPNTFELFNPVFGERDLRSAQGSYVKRGYQDIKAGDFFIFHIQPPPRTPGQEMHARAAKKMIADLYSVAELQTMELPSRASALTILKVVHKNPEARVETLSEKQRDELFQVDADQELY